MKYNVIMRKGSHTYNRAIRVKHAPDFATTRNANTTTVQTRETRDKIFTLLSQNVDKEFSAEEIARNVMGVDTVSNKTCTKFRKLLNSIVNEPGSPIQMGSMTNKKGPVSGRTNVYWYDAESSSPDAMEVDAEEPDGE